MKIVVYHEYFGCDTGCCGHVVELDNVARFAFDHPDGGDTRQFVIDLVTEELGAEHVADINWEEVLVVDD